MMQEWQERCFALKLDIQHLKKQKLDTKKRGVYFCNFIYNTNNTYF